MKMSDHAPVVRDDLRPFNRRRLDNFTADRPPWRITAQHVPPKVMPNLHRDLLFVCTQY